MIEKRFFVYILASQRNGTLYIGVTSGLLKRIWEPKQEVADGFTKKHAVKDLVYFEIFENPENAIHREKRLKKYTRKAKLKLIEKDNPDWIDLYTTVIT